MILSKYEKEIILDKEFLTAKISVIKNIQDLFEIVRKDLYRSSNNSNFNFPNGVDIRLGKIFKGENYRNLPYVILDYPKLYSKETIFTYRTMFWWGNFFSSTLHLQGNALSSYREKLINSKDKLLSKELFVCVNSSPWEYHYGKDNYSRLNNESFNYVKKHNFLKLSSHFPLDDIDNLPRLATEYLRFYMEILAK